MDAATVMLAIGGVGLVLLTLTLIFGDHFDGLMGALDNDLISGVALAGFLAALGFTGALALSAGLDSAPAIALGLLTGAATAIAATRATRRLMRGGTSGTVRLADLIGLHGTVVEEVPAQGYGAVHVVASGTITRLHARSDEPLAVGSEIVVTEVLSPTAVQVLPRSRWLRPAD